MNNCSILLFHSVDERNAFSLRGIGNIRPADFEDLLHALRKEFDIVSLKDVIDCLSGSKRNSGRMIALTFDDGAKSYATNAVPLMKELGMPSTCFLITACIGDKALYWRYIYNYCVSKGYGRQLSKLLEDEYGEPVPADRIISFTRTGYEKEKTSRVMDRILRNIISEEEYREGEGELFLSFNDIEMLKRSPLVEFGIHTHSHPVMIHLSDDEIWDELSLSLDFYHTHIGKDMPMFSIPFGRLYQDFDERTIRAAVRYSLKHIFSAYGGGNREGQPLYNIRRIPVDESMLERGIDSFVSGLIKADVPEHYVISENRLRESLAGLDIS